MEGSAAGASAAIDLVVRLARALHAYGTPAHVLEEALHRVARRLGLAAQFFATPTSVFAAFGAGAEQRLVLERLEPGEVDLGKLTDLDRLIDELVGVEQVGSELVGGGLAAGEASARLDEIVERPARYGAALTTLAYAAASGSAARFFGGGWNEMAAAGAVGLVLGLLAAALGRSETGRRLFEPLGATAAAALATALAVVTGAVSAFVVTLAGLIVLVPGLTLTVALRELATRNLVAGSSRLAGAVTVFITIAFGVAFGSRAVEALLGAPPQVIPVPLPLPADALALAVSAAALTVLFRARPADLGWVFAAGALALTGGRAGTALLGPELGALLAALAVGIGSNLFARLARRPAAVMQVPALVLLVPGSIGFRSLSALLERETVTGVQTAFSMLLIAVALVTGLLLANAVVRPRRVF
jgi:uncharacterized membrane protein YjjP (DUF1212 family)